MPSKPLELTVHLDVRDSLSRRKSLEIVEACERQVLKNQLPIHNAEVATVAELLFLETMKHLLGVPDTPCFPTICSQATPTAKQLQVWKDRAIKMLLSTPIQSDQLQRNFHFLKLLYKVNIL